MSSDSVTPTNLPLSLAFAVVESSSTPLLVLDGALTVIAASGSFCRAFEIDPATVRGRTMFDLWAGDWDERRLRSLLTATAHANVSIDAYEMDLKSDRHGARRVVLNANKLDYGDPGNLRLLVSITDVTDLRESEKVHEKLVLDKALLLRELQHRIANSLQIIASIIMQSARKTQSEELRSHLHAAHDRVISIAAVQQHLAGSPEGTVALRSYFNQLGSSIAASMISDPEQLSIEVCVDDSSVEDETSVSLGLIVTELVINALKHGFPEGRHGKISIDYSSRGPDWTLSVSDNGIGMPALPAIAAAGLGTTIIEALARQLDARVKITDAHPGTTVSLAHLQASATSKGGTIVKLRQAV